MLFLLSCSYALESPIYIYLYHCSFAFKGCHLSLIFLRKCVSKNSLSSIISRLSIGICIWKQFFQKYLPYFYFLTSAITMDTTPINLCWGKQANISWLASVGCFPLAACTDVWFQSDQFIFRNDDVKCDFHALKLVV